MLLHLYALPNHPAPWMFTDRWNLFHNKCFHWPSSRIIWPKAITISKIKMLFPARCRKATGDVRKKKTFCLNVVYPEFLHGNCNFLSNLGCLWETKQGEDVRLFSFCTLVYLLVRVYLLTAITQILTRFLGRSFSEVNYSISNCVHGLKSRFQVDT